MTQYFGVFGSLTFKPYEFEKYPKFMGWADAEKQTPIIVQNEKEEFEFLNRGTDKVFVSPEEKMRLEKEKVEAELAETKKELENLKKPAPAIKTAEK